jgi:hypothetical protein
MIERIEWHCERLIAIRRAIRDIDTGPELVADDFGIGRNAILEMGQPQRAD